MRLLHVGLGMRLLQYETITCRSGYETITCRSGYETITCRSGYETVTFSG